MAAASATAPIAVANRRARRPLERCRPGAWCRVHVSPPRRALPVGAKVVPLGSTCWAAGRRSSVVRPTRATKRDRWFRFLRPIGRIGGTEAGATGPGVPSSGQPPVADTSGDHRQWPPRPRRSPASDLRPSSSWPTSPPTTSATGSRRARPSTSACSRARSRRCAGRSTRRSRRATSRSRGTRRDRRSGSTAMCGSPRTSPRTRPTSPRRSRGPRAAGRPDRTASARAATRVATSTWRPARSTSGAGCGIPPRRSSGRSAPPSSPTRRRSTG